MQITIEGGLVLGADGILDARDVEIDAGVITDVVATARPSAAALRIDARGRLVLPGIVDIHGDAFERQLMPRPGVDIRPDIALHDTDRQLLASGITTAFHGVTWSWEPGLRGRDGCVAALDAIDALRPRLGCDTRVHLRFEIFNLPAADEVEQWISARRIDLLAFNDHTPEIHGYFTRDDEKARRKRERYLARTGLSMEAMAVLTASVVAGADEVAGCVARLSAAARGAGIPQLSHDDVTAETRRSYAELGCRIAEFPKTREAAAAARSDGDPIVFGAPNVMRGGSHNGSVDAAEMVAEGLCTVLASDYYYPSMLHAAWRLADARVEALAAPWALISANPAAALGLDDRGEIGLGRRADLLVVDVSEGAPRVEATVAGGVPWLFGARIAS